MKKKVENLSQEKTHFVPFVQLTQGGLRFFGFAHFQWFRHWTGGEWWHCVYFSNFTEWQRPEEFHRTHIVEKSVDTMEVWG